MKKISFIVAKIVLLNCYQANAQQLENLVKGNEYVISIKDEVTGKQNTQRTIIVTAKNENEILIRWGSDLHVYDRLLRAKKRSNWTYEPFGCDGLASNMKNGFTEIYKYVGIWEKDNQKNEWQGNCIVRVGEEKKITINGKEIVAVYVENIRSYSQKKNQTDLRMFIQNGYFSSEVGFWVEGEWIEKRDNKLFSHSSFKLEKYDLMKK